MATRYTSYLVRSWHAEDGARRIVIEHIQSGTRVAVPTLDALVARIAAWEEDDARPAAHHPDTRDDEPTTTPRP